MSVSPVASRLPPRRDFLLMLALSVAIAVAAAGAHASDVGADQTALEQQQPSAESRQPEDHPAKQDAKQNDEPEPSAPPRAPGPKAPSLCDSLATAAATNDLPVDFFNHLIWQESRFKADAISPKGAQGIAQFMPETARLSGLENPFNPLEAIAKSGQLLRALRDEFGNLGLAAAAYNAGSARVHDWLGGRKPLPQETRAYVRLVTGRSVEEWTKGAIGPIAMASVDLVPCNLAVAGVIQPKGDTKGDASAPKGETVKPWGVQVVGGINPEKALARYREWRSKYAAIVGDREPHVVIRGMIGEMGAALVRVGEDTRAGADKLCAALKAAGAYCDVLRN